MANCRLSEARDFCHSYYQNVTFRGGVPQTELDRFVDNFNVNGSVFDASECLIPGGDTTFSWYLVYKVVRRRWIRSRELRTVFSIGLPLGLLAIFCNIASIPLLLRRIQNRSPLYTYHLALALIDIFTMVLTGVYSVHTVYVYAWESRPLCLYGLTIPFMNSIQSLTLGSVLTSNFLLCVLSFDFMKNKNSARSSGQQSSISHVDQNHQDSKSKKRSSQSSIFSSHGDGADTFLLQIASKLSGLRQSLCTLMEHQIARISLLNFFCYFLGFSVALGTTMSSTIVHGRGTVDPYRYFCIRIDHPPTAEFVPPYLHPKYDCVHAKKGAYAEYYQEIVSSGSQKGTFYHDRFVSTFNHHLAYKHLDHFFGRCMAREYDGVNPRNITRQCERVSSSMYSFAAYAVVLIVSYAMLAVCFGYGNFNRRKEETENAVLPFNNDKSGVALQNAPAVVCSNDQKRPAAADHATTCFTIDHTTESTSDCQQSDPDSTILDEVRSVLMMEMTLAMLQMFASLASILFDLIREDVSAWGMNVDVIDLVLEIFFGICFILACSLNTFFLIFPFNELRKSVPNFKTYLRQNCHPYA